MTRPRLRVAAPLAAVLLALPLLEACGGAPPPAAASPSPPPAEDLGTAEGALAAVTDAERTINQLVGAAPGSQGMSSQGAVAPAVQPSPPPPPPPAAAPPAPMPAGAAPAPASAARPMSSDEDNGPREKAPDPCAMVCRALASMQRATEHLCSLAGADDARCTSARDRVTGASARVHMVCPACGG